MGKHPHHDPHVDIDFLLNLQDHHAHHPHHDHREHHPHHDHREHEHREHEHREHEHKHAAAHARLEHASHVPVTLLMI